METEKTGVVYRIYHKASMKSYIGKSVEFDKRLRQHLGARSNTPALCNAIKKYGVDAFCVEILEFAAPEAWLSKLEILHIRFFNSKTPNGYNLTDGGEGSMGMKISEETRQKKKGRTPWNKGKTGVQAHSPETRRKISESLKGINTWMTGKKHSPETRRKLSEANTGKKHSQDAREKMKGRTAWNKGKTGIYSPETRRKLSEANTGKKHSPATRQKISDAQKGRKHSQDAREKISDALKGNTWNKGKPRSPETRKKISESMKGKNTWMKGKSPIPPKPAEKSPSP